MMLSSQADAVYWMSRYLERAGNIARFLEVNWHLNLDLPGEYAEQWKPLLVTTGDSEDFEARYSAGTMEHVIFFLTADPANPNSIRSCLQAARRNAMRIRDLIPTEMWEAVNTFYHSVQNASKASEIISEDPFSYCADVKWRNLVIGGIASDIMANEEAWHFFQLGRLLERADKTSRILDVKYYVLLPSLDHVGSVTDSVQWSALLKATGGFQAFRHAHGRIEPQRVADFMLLDHDFPRSVLYCLTQAQQSLHQITGTRIGHFSNPAELRLGQVCASLSYHTIEEIFDFGLHEFIDGLQARLNTLDTSIYDTFFAMLPAITSESD